MMGLVILQENEFKRYGERDGLSGHKDVLCLLADGEAIWDRTARRRTRKRFEEWALLRGGR